MKKFACILVVLLLAIPGRAASPADVFDDATNTTAASTTDNIDELEAIEAVVIDEKVVEKVSNSSTTLDDMVTRDHHNTRSEAVQHYDVNRSRNREDAVSAQSKAGHERANATLDQGGQEAQRIRQESTRDAAEAEQRKSFANEFVNEVEEGVEYGFHEAGYVVGEGIADKVLGTDGKRHHRRPHRLHHDDVHDSD